MAQTQFQLPSGVWYDTATNQIIPTPQSSTGSSSQGSSSQDSQNYAADEAKRLAAEKARIEQGRKNAIVAKAQQLVNSGGGSSLKQYYDSLPAADKTLIYPNVITPQMMQGMSSIAMAPEQVKSLQLALVSAGALSYADFQTGPGVYGPKTKAAVASWRAKNPSFSGPDSDIIAVVSNTYTAIHPDMTKEQYADTPDGKNSANDTISTAGATSGVGNGNAIVNAAMVNSSSTLANGVKPLDFNTPEGKAAMEAIDTSFYDTLQKTLTAQTDQEHTVANADWARLRDFINTNLGINLSNNAVQAWDQMQQLKENYSGRNLGNSGLQNESMDDYLRKVRSNDQTQRYTAQTKQEEALMTRYKQFATPAEVKAFIDSSPQNAQLAKDWGLVPSDGMNLEQRISNLKSQYPDKTSEEIAASLTPMYDEYGNYRSSLYQKYMTGGNKVADQGSADPLQTTYDQYGNITGYGNLQPKDTGYMDIEATRLQAQKKNVEVASSSKELAKVALAKAGTAAGQIAGETDPAGSQIIKPTTQNQGVTSSTSNPASTGESPYVQAGIDQAANQGKPGYNILGEKIPSGAGASGVTLPSTAVATPPALVSSAPQYTFTKTPYGTVERRNSKGILEGTGTADFMKAYGYAG